MPGLPAAPVPTPGRTRCWTPNGSPRRRPFRADGGAGTSWSGTPRCGPGAGVPGAGLPAPGRVKDGAQEHSSSGSCTGLVLSRPLPQARRSRNRRVEYGEPFTAWGRNARGTIAPPTRRTAHTGHAGLRWPLKARRGRFWTWAGGECLHGWEKRVQGPARAGGAPRAEAHSTGCLWPMPATDELVTDELVIDEPVADESK